MKVRRRLSTACWAAVPNRGLSGLDAIGADYWRLSGVRDTAKLPGKGLDGDQDRLQGLGRAVRPARAARLLGRGGEDRPRRRLRLRPLPALAPPRRARAERAGLARRARRGDRAGDDRDQRPHPDPPLQPVDRRPGLRHARRDGAGAGLPRRRHRRVAERDARHRRRVPGGERAAPAARRGGDADRAAVARGPGRLRRRVLRGAAGDDLRQARGAGADLHRRLGPAGGETGGTPRRRLHLHQRQRSAALPGPDGEPRRGGRESRSRPGRGSAR